MRRIIGMLSGVILVLVIVSGLASFTPLPTVLNWAIGLIVGFIIGNLIAGKKN